MKYQVPQFIGVEDKIFGPLTAKQFLYVAGAAAFAFILWTVLPRILAIIIGLPIVALFLAFAFYQYNNQPFINVFESSVKYFMSSKIYIWKKIPKTPKEMEKADSEKSAASYIPKLSDSKLKDLSWSLDIKEKIE